MAYAASRYDVSAADNGSGLSFVDMWYLRTENVLYPQSGRIFGCKNLLSPEGNPPGGCGMLSENFTGFAPLGIVVNYLHVRTEVLTFRIYRYRASVWEWNRKKNYPIGDCPQIAVERHWWRRLYYSASHCRHAVSVGGTSSDSGDCDGLRFRGLRI